MGWAIFAFADIPLCGRIVAVCDVFDALTHERAYKPAWPFDQAVAEITSQRGHMFEPRVVDAFLSLPPRVIAPEDRSGGLGPPRTA
jgi:putative two-component system response regulator